MKKEKGTASESKGERKSSGTTATMTPEVAQKEKSALGTEEEATEDIEVIDSSELNELMEMMEPDSSLEDIRYPSEEDEDSEDVMALTATPKRIARKTKKPVSKSVRAGIDRYTEEETRPMRVWLLSACRSCGSMIRFLSDEPQPPTCGKPQCIKKFEEKSKAGTSNKVL